MKHGKAYCLCFLTIQDAAYRHHLLLFFKMIATITASLHSCRFGEVECILNAGVGSTLLDYEGVVLWAGQCWIIVTCQQKMSSFYSNTFWRTPVQNKHLPCFLGQLWLKLKYFWFSVDNQKYNPSNSSNSIIDLMFPQKDILSCVFLTAHQSTLTPLCSQLFSLETYLR